MDDDGVKVWIERQQEVLLWKQFNINMNDKDIQQEIESLKSKLTGNMIEDMEIRDTIHNLEMKLKGVKPMDSHFDCIGCGS
jgi:hypothetical protein